ncbi:MAG TPA: response regulator [Gaiellaceae bacterium]|nr:response regulator [Gaiellaceae bacterium]
MTPLIVLIVDDDARNRKLARDVLGFAGFDTLEAATGEEAIALAGERLPDVVLMDLRLPDLDGSEALRRLKAERATAHIPVVALTAVTGAREALNDAGFAGTIEKPIDVRDFPNQVRRHCIAR